MEFVCYARNIHKINGDAKSPCVTRTNASVLLRESIRVLETCQRSCKSWQRWSVAILAQARLACLRTWRYRVVNSSSLSLVYPSWIAACLIAECIIGLLHSSKQRMSSSQPPSGMIMNDDFGMSIPRGGLSICSTGHHADLRSKLGLRADCLSRLNVIHHDALEGVKENSIVCGQLCESLRESIYRCSPPSQRREIQRTGACWCAVTRG